MIIGIKPIKGKVETINPELYIEVHDTPEFKQAFLKGIDIATSSSVKLILILRQRSVKFSKVFEQTLQESHFFSVNVGQKLASMLLNENCSSDVPSILREENKASEGNYCVLDNCEILFDDYLDIDAFSLLKQLAKLGGIIACIDAAIEDNQFVYGKPNQPDYQTKKDLRDILVINAKEV